MNFERNSRITAFEANSNFILFEGNRWDKLVNAMKVPHIDREGRGTLRI